MILKLITAHTVMFLFCLAILGLFSVFPLLKDIPEQIELGYYIAYALVALVTLLVGVNAWSDIRECLKLK